MEDASSLAELHIATRRASMAYLPDLHTDEETHAWMREVVLALCEVWAAHVAGQAVGFMALHGEHLEHLYVLPEFQRHGIGGRLLALAKERSPDGLTLWVFQQNTQARTFYASHGFVPERFTDGAENEEREPDVMLRWSPTTE